MAKKNRRKAESTPVAEQVPVQEAVVDTAAAKQQPAQPKQSARVMAIAAAEEQRDLRMGIVLGAIFFAVLSLTPVGSIKGMAMAALVTAVAVLFAKRDNFCANFSLPVVFILLYAVMDTVSSFYALATKFSLTEFLKIAIALAVFILVLSLEPRRGHKSGLRTATMVEVAMAVASFISIDFVSTRIFSGIVTALFGPVNQLYPYLEGTGSGRIQTLFENPNVFAGCAGLAVLLSLGLLSATDDKKNRRIHLVCLMLTSSAFILAFSRAAAGMIAVAFLVYLLLERGEKRVKALVVMVEVFIFALIASIPTLMTTASNWNGFAPGPLVLLVGATAAFVMVDERFGRKATVSLAKYEKAAILLPAGFVAAAVIFLILAMNITSGATLSAGEPYTRTATLDAGTYALDIVGSDAINVTVTSQTRDEVFMGTTTEIYSGGIDGVSFTVPEESMVTTFRFTSEVGGSLESVSYSGPESGELKLDYVLLPTAVVSRLVGMFQSTAFQQRIMLFENGLELFARQPIYGLGLGSFENALASIQEFHYETKYVHNHYIQRLVDTGILGLIFFLGILLSCAVLLLKSWRRGKEEMHPLTPALFAALIFSMLHAALEVVYSASFYLPIVFAIFALIVLCCGDAVSVSGGQKAFVWAQRAYLAFVAVWIVFLGLNIYAKSITVQATYEELITATKLDRYERNDYMLTYVYSMASEEERTAEGEAQMYEYMDRLEQVNSNAIPLYLAECYFNLDQTEKAFDMLRKFTAYTASDEEKWDAAYRKAAQFYDESEEFYNGLASLVKDMNAWNESHVGEIVLEPDIANFIIHALSK